MQKKNRDRKLNYARMENFMYYEEKIIDGKLHCRITPDGEWRRIHGEKANAVSNLLLLSDQQRLDVFRFFCCHCGRLETGPRPCQCNNDD